MVVRCQTADDVSAARSAISGVFDGVGLVLSAKVLTLPVRLARGTGNRTTNLDDRLAFCFFFDCRRRIFRWICRKWIGGRVRNSVFPRLRRQDDDVLVGHDSAVGEDQAIAVGA